ncbi:putative transcriptional regulator, GntR family protein [Pseudonocardia sulfidoxydans NBRC 16205]|uniref:Putative transcriptional regulator, GntR family protein n=1 Tax=Pseudonocardia sulfidoxydans NBRC 16205 TaxID=1223511 RepID=A0A511DR48_9PSEU|nr:GntR family transcriptional regulator [Pseudonocardia sulfidoxydans]GEL25538.1 putative transcriptional regulator, GntR family protein [Pseudonocardia sulfidoxydans NBRC 16205]
MPVPGRDGLLATSLLRDRAYTAIRDAIVDGTLAPGEKLVDAELSSWLGVSRTPIREALGRLERSGLVLTRPGHSTVVSPVRARETAAAQSVVAAMHELATREAVPLLSAADLDAMRVANACFAEALRDNDIDAAVQADDDFHGVAVAASGNGAVRAVLDQFGPVLRRVERMRFGSLAGRGSVAQHDRIVELCAAGDVGGAAAAARENWLTLAALVDTLED